MLNIYTSNNIDSLIEKLSDIIKEENKGKSIFDSIKHRIIIPTVVNKEWLNFELLKHMSSLFNIEYDTLDWSPYKIAKDLGIEHLDQTVSKKDLFFDILAIFNNDKIDIKLFKDYFNDTNENIKRAKKFQLAEKLSDLFVDYLENDNDLINNWNNIIENEDLEKDLKGIEKEEYLIYKELCKKKYNQAKFLNINNIDFKKDATDKNLCNKLKIYVFNYPYISKGTLELLINLSEVVDVSIFINPINKNFPDSVLELQNKFFDNIKEVIGDKFYTLNDDNINHNTVLDLIKSNQNKNKISQDTSFQVFSCQGTYREAECVYNSIIKNLQDNKDLRLEDICVLLTDINKYYPIVNGVFNKHSYKLPFNFVCATPNIENSYINGIKLLCSLVDNNLTKDVVIELFSNECFKKKHNISHKEVESFISFVENEHILAFFDKDQKDAYFKNNLSNNWTWKWKSQNLKFGNIIDINEEYDHLDWHNILPESNYNANQKLLNIIEKIYTEYTYLNSENHVAGLKKEKEKKNIVKNIINNFADFVNEFLEPINASDSINLLLDNCFDDLYNQFNMREYYPKFMELFDYMIKEGGSSNYQKGRAYVNGIIVSDLKRMRLSNYKIVYILGLNEGVFPRKDENSSLDLSNKENRVSITNQDKYSLYKIICSTKEKVYLTYSNKDLEKDAPLYKSGTLDELLTWVKENLLNNKEFIEIQMPKFSRSLDYYKVEYLNQYKDITYDIVNYDTQDYNLSLIEKALDNKIDFTLKEEANPLIEPTLDIFAKDNIIDLDINDIVKYLLNPLDWTLEQVDIKKEFTLKDEQNYEPLDIKSWNENKIFNETINKSITNRDFVDKVLEKYDNNGLIPEGCIGLNYKRKIKDLFNKFITITNEDLKYKIDIDILPYECTYNGNNYRITGTIPILEDNYKIYIIDPHSYKVEKEILRLKLLMLLYKIQNKNIENIEGYYIFNKEEDNIYKYTFENSKSDYEDTLKKICDFKDFYNVFSYEAYLKNDKIENMKDEILKNNNHIYLNNLIIDLPKKFKIVQSDNIDKIKLLNDCFEESK